MCERVCIFFVAFLRGTRSTQIENLPMVISENVSVQSMRIQSIKTIIKRFSILRTSSLFNYYQRVFFLKLYDISYIKIINRIDPYNKIHQNARLLGGQVFFFFVY